jgi:general secretion pathway protein G
MAHRKGFTLIELLVVLAVVAMLLSLVAPRYIRQADKAKEAVLRENLTALRLAIDQRYGDKGAYPDSLDQLVEERYLRKLPVDPITQRSDTWQTVTLDEEGGEGIYDVKSGAEGLGMNSTAYSSW